MIYFTKKTLFIILKNLIFFILLLKAIVFIHFPYLLKLFLGHLLKLTER